MIGKPFISNRSIYNKKLSNFYCLVKYSAAATKHNLFCSHGVKQIQITCTRWTSYCTKRNQYIRVNKSIYKNDVFSTDCLFKHYLPIRN